MSVYQSVITEFSSDFSKTYSAGCLLLEVHFRWDENAQEQWDILDRAIQAKQDSDPLINL